MKRILVRALSLFIAWAGYLVMGVSHSPGAESRSAERPTIKSDEVIEDDLYVFGDEITVDGEVKGDVVAFGRFVKINGSVQGDLIAAAQAIVISGEVGDDVRVAGQTLKIDDNARVTDDVIAAGFSLEIAGESSVGGDLLYAGYQALLAGDIEGDVAAGMANCEVSGSIGGDADLSVGGDDAGAQAYMYGSSPPVAIPEVPPGLTIHDTARIGGELKYESETQLELPDEIVTGEIRHKLPSVETIRPPTPSERAISVLGRYAALLLVGLGVVLIAPRWTRRIADNIQTHPIGSFFLGLAGGVGLLILLPSIILGAIFFAAFAGFIKLTALVPVFIVLGLSGCAMLVVGFWFFTGYLAEIVVGLLVGRWFLALANPKPSQNRFLSLIAGLVLLALISSVPYVGPIVGWLFVVFALGALVRWLFWKRSPEPRHVGKPQPA